MYFGPTAIECIKEGTSNKSKLWREVVLIAEVGHPPPNFLNGTALPNDI